MLMVDKPHRVFNLLWEAPTHDLPWSLNHVVLLGHVKNWILNISTGTRPMATNYGKVVT